MFVVSDEGEVRYGGWATHIPVVFVRVSWSRLFNSDAARILPYQEMKLVEDYQDLERKK
jgi:hypothetical protein